VFSIERVLYRMCSLSNAFSIEKHFYTERYLVDIALLHLEHVVSTVGATPLRVGARDVKTARV
jgi:hypothetical protein